MDESSKRLIAAQRKFTALKLKFDPLNCEFKVHIATPAETRESGKDIQSTPLDTEYGWIDYVCRKAHTAYSLRGFDTRKVEAFEPSEPRLSAWVDYPIINLYSGYKFFLAESAFLLYVLMSKRSCMSAIWCLWDEGFSDYYAVDDSELFINAMRFQPLKNALNEIVKRIRTHKEGADSPRDKFSDPVMVPVIQSAGILGHSISVSIYRTINLELLYMFFKYVPEAEKRVLWADVFDGDYRLTEDVKEILTYSEDPAERLAQFRTRLKTTSAEYPCYSVGKPLMTATLCWILNSVRTTQARLIYGILKNELDKTKATDSLKELAKLSELFKDAFGDPKDASGSGTGIGMEEKSLGSSFGTHEDTESMGKASDIGGKTEITFLDDDVERKYGTYRIVVHKTPESETDLSYYTKRLEAFSGILAQFGRRLRDIRTYNTGGKMPGQISGKLDRKNLYRYKTTSKIFYNNTYKQHEQDLAVGVLLDESGSMNCDHGIKNGRAALILLHEVLTNLHINHCIAGHTSSGAQHHVIINPYVWFRENPKYSPRKCTALARITAKNGNCDSGALYFMEQELLRANNKDKLCLIFSDGEPTECTGAELRAQVAHMEKNHIKVIGIGVNFPSIARYYTSSANGKTLQEMLNIVCDILQQYILQRNLRGER